MTRIANRDARKYVQTLQPFEGSNLDGQLEQQGDRYVVYSYQTPIWVYLRKHDTWVGTKQKYSVTSTKHQNQTHPLAERVVWLGSYSMDRLMLTEVDLSRLIIEDNLR